MPPQSRVVGRVSVRVMPDTSQFRSDLTEALERLERTLSVQVPVGLDTDGVRSEAAQATREIESQVGDVTADVEADTAGAEAQIAQVARDRTSTIGVDVDRASLARAGRALGRVGGGAAGLPAAAGGIATLGAGAAVAAGQIVELAAALAPAAGALAALPAAASSAGAALATLQVATAGVGEAMGAALTGDATELAEALEGLAPAAQQVVREVSALRPQVDALRESVQQEFFAPLVGQMQQVGGDLLPVLTEGMSELSGAMGEAASEAVAFAGSAQALDFLDDLFSSTTTAVGNAEGAVGDLLSGLTELGGVGLPYVEDLGTAVGDLAADFNDWATQAADSGQAVEWIDGAIDLFSQLGDIASNLGGIFGSIFSGAGDGGILGTIEELTGALDDFFASAEGQEALSGLFEGLASIGSALSPVIEALASGIGALAPAIGRIAEAFGPVLTSAIEGLTPALAALEPGITSIIDALGEGIDALVASGALEDLGTALSDILTAVAPILPVMGELAAVLAGALAETLTLIAPHLQTMVEAFVEGLEPVLPEIAEAFSSLVESLGPLLPQIIDAFLPAIEALPELLLLLVPQLLAMAEMLRLSEPLWPVLIAALELASDNFATLVTWLGDAVEWLSDLVEDVREAGWTIEDSVEEMKRRVTGFFEDLGNFIDDTVSSIQNWIENAFEDARDAAVGAATGLRDGVEGAIDDAVNFVTGLPGEVTSAFAGAAGWLWDAGQDIIDGLIDGIESMLGWLGSTMDSVASTVTDYLPFSPARRGPLRSRPPDRAGRSIAEMLADGLGAGERAVATAMEGVAGAATPAAVATAGVSGSVAGQSVSGRTGSGSAITIEQYNEQGHDVRQIAEDLMLLAGARGGGR